MLGSLGTFTMLMCRIFPFVNEEKASFAISYRSEDKLPGLYHLKCFMATSRMFIGGGSRYLSFPVYRCRVPWIQKLASI